MLNQIILVGKVIEEPQLRSFGDNNQLATVLLEVERSFVASEGQTVSEVFQITLWRNMIKSGCELCAVGNIVGVKGRLQAHNYVSRENKEYYSCDIIAEKISLLNGK